MFEENKTVLEEFNNLLDNYISNLESEIKQLDKTNKIKNILIQLKSNRKLDFLLENKDQIIEISPNLANHINAISYLIENNAGNIEQVGILLDTVLNDKNISKHIKENNKTKQEELDHELIECKNIKNKDYDFDFLNHLFKKMELSDDQIITILSQIAYYTSTLSMKKETAIEKNIDPITPIEEEVIDLPIENNKEINIEDITREYENTIRIANEIIDRFYPLIKEKSKRQIEYSKALLACMEEENENINDFDYSEQKLIVLVLDLIKNKKDLESELRKVENINNIDKDTKDYLNLFLSELDKLVREIKQVSFQLDKENREMENDKACELYYLLDNNETPTFDINSFDKDNKKKAYSLIAKLEKGIFDYERSKAHSLVQSKNKIDLDVFVNKFSGMCCSYVRFSEDQILILTFDDKDNIFSRSENIALNYSTYINDYIKKLKEKDPKVLNAQSNFITNLNESRSEELNEKNR